jgi:ankyrin repeat protein
MTAQLGFVEIFELLVRSGANIDAKLSSGETALELAGANRHAGIVAFLTNYRRELEARRLNSTAQF